MLSRNQSVYARLKLAFSLFSGFLVLVCWVAGLSYYFFEARQDTLNNAHAQAAMIASQSSAAVMFDDRAVLNAQLSILSQLENVRWALIAVPDPGSNEPGGLSVIAQYGSVPQNLDELRRVRAASDRSDIAATRFRLVAPIALNGTVHADLYVEVSFESRLRHILSIAIGSLAFSLILLWIGRTAFERIVTSVSAPIGELATLADRVAMAGITSDRASDRSEDEVGHLARAFNQMLDRLAAHQSELGRSRDELRALSGELQRIREQERTRISHEIHDELGQRLTSIKYEIARLTEGKARELLSTMTDETIAIVRTISWELRPSLLDSMGLLAAIEWLAQDFQKRTQITCALSLPAENPDLDPECSTDLFRICQELLTNVARHAKARRVDVRVDIEEAQIVLEVEDYGSGFDAGKRRADRQSIGLLGVRERALRWGGSIEITAAAAQGTRVRVSVPLNPGGRQRGFRI